MRKKLIKRVRRLFGAAPPPKKKGQGKLHDREKLVRWLPKGGTIIEVGVDVGDFSDLMLRALAPEKLHLVDPWKAFEEEKYDRSMYGAHIGQQTMNARFRSVKERFAEEPRVEIHRMMSLPAAEKFADGGVDIVYLDADHSESGVTGDVLAYWPKLKVGGILCGDDYHRGGWWGDGVIHGFGLILGRRDAMVGFKSGGQIAVQKINGEGA